MQILTDETFMKLGTGMTKKELEIFLQSLIQASVEEMLRILPNTITHLVKSVTAMKTVADKFYVENPSLVDHKDIVTKTLESLEESNPGKPMAELLNLTIPIVKTKLTSIQGTSSEIVAKPTLDSLDSVIGEL